MLIVGVGGRMGTGKSSACQLICSWNKYRAWRYGTVSSGDVARTLPQTEGTREVTARTGRDPREDLIRVGVLNRIKEQSALGVQILLLDGFPRAWDQWEFMEQYRPLDHYFLVQDDRSVDFVKARGRGNLEEELSADRAQTELLAILRLRLQGVEYRQRLRTINSSDKTIIELAAYLDAMCRNVYLDKYGEPWGEACVLCRGYGMVGNSTAEYEPCVRCKGMGVVI